VTEGVLLLLVGAILAASVVLAFAAARTGLPVLVAFLGLAMLLGSDGPGGIEFDRRGASHDASASLGSA
jgi:NhaP-type Na+/H+ and K+/H+ antiporter